MKPRFKIGDVVSVQMNTQDADSGIWLDGWRGRVVSVDADVAGSLQLLYTVAWDSVTINQMPNAYIFNAHARGVEWHSYMLTARDLVLSSARDSEVQTAAARAAVEDTVLVPGRKMAPFVPGDEFVGDEYDVDEYGVDEYDVGEYDLSFDDDEFADMEPPTLDEFFGMLEIPAREQSRLRTLFYRAIRNLYEEPPSMPRDEQEEWIMMHIVEPLSLGAAAAAACKSDKISDATKLKLAGSALTMVDPMQSEGFPDSAEVLLCELARQDQLDMTLFAMTATSAELTSYSWWLASLTLDCARTLTDFLVAHAGQPERLEFWLSVLAFQSRSVPHLGGRLADLWLRDERIPQPVRRSLCNDWLALKSTPGGEAPVMWRLFDALYRHDAAAARPLLDQLLDEQTRALNTVTGRSQAEIEEALQSLHQFAAQFRESLDLADESGVQPDGALGPGGRGLLPYALLPTGFVRRAVPGALALGAEPLPLLERAMAVEDQYFGEPLALGVADALDEFGHRLEPAQLRAWVDAGRRHGRANVRKAFYRLGRSLYGVEYLQPAMDDAAASIRTWAAKQIRKG